MIIAVMRDRAHKSKRNAQVRRHRFAVDALGGSLADTQGQELRTAAGKRPLHKLMTQATTAASTELASAAA